MGVKVLRRAKVSSRGERFVGVISTSMSDRAGLGGSAVVVLGLEGEAKGFLLLPPAPGVTAVGESFAFVGVRNGFLDGVLAAPSASPVDLLDFLLDGVLNTSSCPSSLCLELEASLDLGPAELLDLDLAFASPPAACQVS